MLDPDTLKSYENRFQAVRTINADSIIPPQQRGHFTIKEAGTNSLFVWEGKSFYVQQVCNYEETSDDFSKRLNYTVTELLCLCLETGETSYFEWEVDDDLEVTSVVERLAFRDLTDDAGEAVDGDDLDTIADDRDIIVYKSEQFWYEDDWPAIYSCRGREEKVYMYEFSNRDGSKYITVEEWGQEHTRHEYQIYLSRPVRSGGITLICREYQ